MVASAALIWACVPESVSVEEPFAPALMVAPPARLTFSTPFVTVSCVVDRLPSTSFTDTPPIARALSSLTLCAPGTAFTGPSFTELTVMATASESVAPLASVESTVRVSPPLKFALPWYDRLASAALICACVPDRVRVEEPFAPALIVAPPASETFSVPLVTVSCVVDRLPSTSLTAIPPTERTVSSLTDCAPGTVFTGPSFTELTVMATASESVAPLPSVESTVSVSAPLKFGLPW
jgi:hypothetical protein